jgi:hypothetical protein
MDSAQRRELDREQWRDLVRGLSLVQAGGYPGCVSISKHFLESPADEVEHLARMAQHIVQEYGLQPTLQVIGDGIVLRIEKGSARAEAGPDYSRLIKTSSPSMTTG